MAKLQIPMIFRDSENVYLEFPAIKDGPQGWVRRFSIAEGGLAMLKLKDIPTIEQHPGYVASAARVLAVHQAKTERKVRVARTKRVPNRYAKEESKEFLRKIGLARKT